MRPMTSTGWILSALVLSILLVGLRAEPEEVPAWNRAAAARYMDGRMTWWSTWPNAARDHGTFCVSCHTALPYALARPALHMPLNEKGPSVQEAQLIENVVKRVRMWKEVEPYYPDQTRGIPKTSESRGTESVLNAVILATRDARDSKLSDDARLAFANLWALQMKRGDLSGAWAWLNFRYEPWEGRHSPYYGATLAAIAVGTAPNAYASTPEIQDNVKLLRDYLASQYEQQPLLNRLMLLWASTKLTGAVMPEQRDAIVADVLRKQQDDGGWSTSSLGAWQRTDGTALETKSDGYATGLVTFVLQAAPGGSPVQAQVKMGLDWLQKHQNQQTGRWTAFSLNKQRDPASDGAQFMHDVATAYAVLALTSADRVKP
jgi:squalene-hopene/tetraprenyl-beta-curcumene cyclase